VSFGLLNLSPGTFYPSNNYLIIFHVSAGESVEEKKKVGEKCGGGEAEGRMGYSLTSKDLTR
jgi:hypothetical protein